MTKHLLLTLFLLTGFHGCSLNEEHPQVRKEYYAKPMTTLGIENFYQVDENVYRSAQPSKDDFKRLYDFGIRNDLNLRQFHDDKEKLEGTPIAYHRVPINTSKMRYDQLVEAVAYLSKAQGKSIVHCLHGSDRTGAVIAGYRIAVNGWSKEKAIDEFEHGGFGYHTFWFPNLPELLHAIDEEKFKEDIRQYTLP